LASYEAARFLQHAQFSSSEAEIATVKSQGAAAWLDAQMALNSSTGGYDWLMQRGYGVIDAHYAPVGAALLWTLEQGLGPAFTADCLETIEEISEEGKEDFMHAGGESFEQIPCLNDQDVYVKYLADRVVRWKPSHH
jgi:protoheme ferro-lyase